VNQRILMVDDDPTVHEVARAYLEHTGYVVESAMTGQGGIGLLSVHSFDLVVVDLGLPDLPGDSVLEEVRRRGSIPVLVLTGATGTDSRVRATTLGAADYLTKPFGGRELVARVQAILRTDA
jgi:DNA-binding response OmpR family regulator